MLSFSPNSLIFKEFKMGVFGEGWVGNRGAARLPTALQEELAGATRLRNTKIRSDLAPGSPLRDFSASPTRLDDLVTEGGSVDVSRFQKMYPDWDPAEEGLMFTMDSAGEIRVGVGDRGFVHHSSLFGPENENVVAAGMMKIDDGLIMEINRSSGHYLPEAGESVPMVEKVLRETMAPLHPRFRAEDYFGIQRFPIPMLPATRIP